MANLSDMVDDVDDVDEEKVAWSIDLSTLRPMLNAVASYRHERDVLIKDVELANVTVEHMKTLLNKTSSPSADIQHSMEMNRAITGVEFALDNEFTTESLNVYITESLDNIAHGMEGINKLSTKLARLVKDKSNQINDLSKKAQLALKEQSGTHTYNVGNYKLNEHEYMSLSSDSTEVVSDVSLINGLATLVTLVEDDRVYQHDKEMQKRMLTSLYERYSRKIDSKTLLSHSVLRNKLAELKSLRSYLKYSEVDSNHDLTRKWSTGNIAGGVQECIEVAVSEHDSKYLTWFHTTAELLDVKTVLGNVNDLTIGYSDLRAMSDLIDVVIRLTDAVTNSKRDAELQEEYTESLINDLHLTSTTFGVPHGDDVEKHGFYNADIYKHMTQQRLSVTERDNAILETCKVTLAHVVKSMEQLTVNN